MDDFAYLSVLISIVLGLGVTQLLSGVVALIRERRRARMYWPVPVWIVTLFLVHVQTWWALFGLRGLQHWNFGGFVIVLMQPVLLFVLSALIVPALLQGEVIDLRRAYFREARWFFSILFALLCVSLAKSLALTGALPNSLDVGAHLVFIALAVVGIAVEHHLVHEVLGPVALVLYTAYIITLFTTLH